MLRGYSRKRNRPKIGVIGSVLIDIIAVSNDHTKEDSIGEVASINIGGCAYNISYYLRQLKCRVSILTALKDRSILTPFIISKLRREGIFTNYIIVSEGIREGIFAAHQVGAEVKKAITSTCIDAVDIRQEFLERFVEDCDIVACDLGLDVREIASLLDIARERGLRVICNGTSDARVLRIKALANDKRFYAVVLNRSEISALVPNYQELIDSGSAQSLREQCRADNVIITLGENGMLTVSADNQFKPYPAVQVGEVRSTVGAGDALTACITAACVRNEYSDILNIDELDDFAAKFREIMPGVLSVQGATRGSDALFDGSVLSFGFASKTSKNYLGVDRDVWMVLGIFLGLAGLGIGIYSIV